MLPVIIIVILDIDTVISRRQWALLYETTKGHANELVKRYRDTKDGRRAWIAIYKEVKPRVSHNIVAAMQKVVNFAIDHSVKPEQQLNELETLKTAPRSCTVDPRSRRPEDIRTIGRK